ncbi:MAG TPA: aconitate hydratase, partial [Arthrobacter bacterium]|nr:aconitate hydratase [Arthrobacter sp.]
LTGMITDPRDLTKLFDLEYPHPELPTVSSVNLTMLEKPLPQEEAAEVQLIKGENISSLPVFGPLADRIEAPVALVVGDDVSTDEILPAGARVLPYRSNIPKLAEFTFDQIDETYPARAAETRDTTGHILVAGANYGQGSSREHAAITPRFLGLRAVLAVSFARIHWQNLANFGVLALEFADAADHDRIQQGDVLVLDRIREALVAGTEILVRNQTRDEVYAVRHGLSTRQVDMLLAGGLIPWLRERSARDAGDRREVR